MEVARLKAILEADTKTAEADLNRAAGAVDNVGRAAGRQGGAAQTMGRAFSAVGATAGYAFAAGIESAAQFEDGLRTINTVARVSDAELATIGDGIQQIARDTGKSTEDLTAAYYDMVSAGIEPGVDAMEALKVSALTGIGALGSTASSADLLTTSLNAWKLETSDSGRVMDIWASAVDQGKTTVDEIGSSLARAAPLAAAMGVEQEELAASLAVMTARGTPTAQAFTQMQAAMTAIQKPNERLLALQEQLGVSFADVAGEKGLTEAYALLRDQASSVEDTLLDLAGVSEDDFPAALAKQQDALGLSNTELDKFIKMAGADGAAQALQELAVATASGEEGIAGALGSVEAFQFMLQTTGENADAFGEAYAEVMDSAGTVAEQSSEKMKSPMEAAARLTQGITTFMQDVAGPFAGTAGPMLLTLNNLGPAFMGPLSPMRLLGTGMGWLATKGIGSLLSGTSRMIGGFSNLARQGPTVLGWMDLGISKVKGFGSALLGGVTSVASFAGSMARTGLTAVGNFALAVGRAGLSVVTFGIRLIAQGVAAVASFAARMILTTATAIAGFVTTIVTTAIPAVIGFASTIFTTAIPALIALAAPFLPIIAIVAVVVAAIAGLFLAWQNNFLGIRDIAATVWNAITGFIDTAITNITGFISGLMEFVAGIWDGVVDAASAVWNGVSGVISGIVNTIIGVISGITGVVQGVWDAVSGFFGFVTGKAATAKAQLYDVSAVAKSGASVSMGGARFGGPSYAEGTMDTGRGGLALLHPREAVLPAEVAAALRSWLGGNLPAADPQGSVHASPVAGAAAANVVVNNYYEAQLQGILPARSTKDVARGLRTLGESGKLVRRTVVERTAQEFVSA